MDQFKVKIVPDHALPEDVKRVIVEKRGCDPTLILAESAACNWWFLQEWERLYDGAYDGFYLRAV